MFKVKINGLEGVLKRIEKYDKALGKGVQDELSQGAKNIAAKARLRAPKGKTGKLGNSIVADVSKPYSKKVTVGAPYAPYVEFGTGAKVFQSEFQFTESMKQYAREFFVSGKGRLKASPFLFPAYVEEIVELKKRIRKLFFE